MEREETGRMIYDDILIRVLMMWMMWRSLFEKVEPDIDAFWCKDDFEHLKQLDMGNKKRKIDWYKTIVLKLSLFTLWFCLIMYSILLSLSV